MTEPFIKDLFVILHLIGFAMGLGAATLVDLSVARYLLKLKPRYWHIDFFDLCSSLIWLALCLIMTSGVVLYRLDWQELGSNPKFLVKMVAVSIIIANGLLIELLTAPRLGELFRSGVVSKTRLRLRRRFAFAFGAISATSWYTAATLGILSELPFSVSELLLMYLALLTLAIAVGLSMEDAVSHRLSALIRQRKKKRREKKHYRTLRTAHDTGA